MTKEERENVIAEHILYVLVLSKSGSGEFSPFQGFSVNTFGVSHTIQYICKLPTTIGELFRAKNEAIRYRSIGLAGYAILLLERDVLHTFDKGLPLTCFVSDSETCEQVEQYVAAQGRIGWLHLTTDEKASSVIKLWDFSRADLASWSRTVAENAIAKKKAEGGAVPSALSWRSFVQWPEETARVEQKFHNITLPTETALQSFNFVLPKATHPLAGNSDDEFSLAVCSVADELERIRHDAGADHHLIPGSPMLIVAVPSVYRHLSPSDLKREATRPARRAFRSILRQRQYIAGRSSGPELKEMLEDRTAVAAMSARAEELRAYTAALSVAASSFGVPVLRCPPQVDRVRELLIRLAGMFRSKTPNVERRNKLALKIGSSLRNAVPEPLIERIEKHQQDGIKLIGDTPLELMPVNGLPLGLRATMSRMPTLPGNLLMRHGLLRTPLLLQPDDLNKVLVVRAFDHDDPLRNLVVDAINIMNSEGQKQIEFQVVDVTTKEEFVNAFNKFEGALAIFDGHGSHERSDPQGTIKIGSIRINPFELYGQIRVPPILFLSACETYTLEGIESGVSSAFLMMGATSVLGTIVPIDGFKAAVLIARFMFRFTNFVPLLGTMISWSQIVSGMLRMSYVTDVLMELGARFSLSMEDYRKIHTAANIAINNFNPGWFEETLSSLAAAVSTSEVEVREAWMRTCYFTDTLHYVHLGQPEHMFVVPSDHPA